MLSPHAALPGWFPLSEAPIARAGTVPRSCRPSPKNTYKPTTDTNLSRYSSVTESPQQSSSTVIKKAGSSSQDLPEFSVLASVPYTKGDAATGGSYGRISVPVAHSTKNTTSGLSPSVVSTPARAGELGSASASLRDDARATKLIDTFMGMAPFSRPQGTRDFIAQVWSILFALCPFVAQATQWFLPPPPPSISTFKHTHTDTHTHTPTHTHTHTHTHTALGGSMRVA